jgi:hypothetical protein
VAASEDEAIEGVKRLFAKSYGVWEWAGSNYLSGEYRQTTNSKYTWNPPPGKCMDGLGIRIRYTRLSDANCADCRPVQADYDADGLTDIAYVKPEEYTHVSTVNRPGNYTGTGWVWKINFSNAEPAHFANMDTRYPDFLPKHYRGGYLFGGAPGWIPMPGSYGAPGVSIAAISPVGVRNGLPVYDWHMDYFNNTVPNFLNLDMAYAFASSAIVNINNLSQHYGLQWTYLTNGTMTNFNIPLNSQVSVLGTNLADPAYNHYATEATKVLNADYDNDHLSDITGIYIMPFINDNRNLRCGSTERYVELQDSYRWYIHPTKLATILFGGWIGGSQSLGVLDSYLANWSNYSTNRCFIQGTPGPMQLHYCVWGEKGEYPIPADYDGDGYDDLATYDPGNFQWSILWSNSLFEPAYLNSFADTSIWPERCSGTNYGIKKYVFGQAGLQPENMVPADYDNDGLTDMAYYVGGQWHIYFSDAEPVHLTPFRISLTGRSGVYNFGDSNSRAVPGKYDDPNIMTLGLYNKTSGTWRYIRTAAVVAPSSCPALGPGAIKECDISATDFTTENPRPEYPDDWCSIIPLVGNIKVNGLMSTTIDNSTNQFVNLTFNSRVNSEQMPMVMMGVDWGDGLKTIVSGVEMRDRPNESEPHSLYHLYSYWEVKSRAKTGLTSNASCYNKNTGPSPETNSNYCLVSPRVIVKDNWGWCNNGSAIDDCDTYTEFVGNIIIKEK